MKKRFEVLIHVRGQDLARDGILRGAETETSEEAIAAVLFDFAPTVLRVQFREAGPNGGRWKEGTVPVLKWGGPLSGNPLTNKRRAEVAALLGFENVNEVCWRGHLNGVERAIPEWFADLDLQFTFKPSPTPGLDPKGAAGAAKPQLQLIPPELNFHLAGAIALGAKKYGPWNWRTAKVESMTYVGAIRRHLAASLEGEDTDPESGVHPLGHVAACCAIVLDARKHGNLADNRPPRS